jgi:DNA polymerase-2
MIEACGWLLDMYDDHRDDLVVWLVGTDGSRLRLHQPFPITFYAAGATSQLRALWRWLESQPVVVKLERRERRDLFQEQPVTVLSVEVQHTAEQPHLFRKVAQSFPGLVYYDADLQLSLRYAAATGTFPLAYCRVSAEEGGLLHSIQALDTRWDLDPEPPPLRVMHLEPDADPNHQPPKALKVRYEHSTWTLSLETARPLLINLNALLEKHDPDMLLTGWGDTWLLPKLVELSRQAGIPLPLNREPGREIVIKPERTYFSYGQIIYKGRQMHLFGRIHIDRRNAMLWGDYDLEGTFESARVTALPIQVAARVSPGTGISSMETLTAMQNGILVPWHKQQVEKPKTAIDLLQRDQGGMIYQPLVGLHASVGMVDFISMYPSLMVKCNISPEVPPPTRLGVSEYPPGLVPLTLAPLLEKRITLKHRANSLPHWDPRRAKDKARSQAYKWLLVTCFGYLGYKNARFGRIESHEAVTTWGREALLTAKEAAEDLGYTVLQMYVDGLWVQQAGKTKPEEFNPLLEEIAARTHLPVGLDGVFRWVAFLPSRVDSRVPVPNRYFGIYQDGTFKVRGIDVRRRDTPEFIGDVQMEVLRTLGRAEQADELDELVPETMKVVRRRLMQLKTGRVPLEKLLVTQKLSRALDAYKDPSPAARAAAQLEALGKHIRPGQRVRFLLLRGQPDVHAWDLPTRPDPRRLDYAYYKELTLRAAGNIFQPMGVSEEKLRRWVDEQGVELGLWERN